MKEREFQPISPELEDARTTLTTRDLEKYESLLDFTKKDLTKWRVVVDLGSGKNQDLARELKKEKIFKGTVISIDPQLAFPEIIKQGKISGDEDDAQWHLRRRKNAQPDTIAAVGQDLPIADKSVDAVLALFSVPWHLSEENANDVKTILTECLRILKENGEARFFPISKERHMLDSVLNFIKEHEDAIQYELRLYDTHPEIPEEKKKYLLILKHNMI